MLATAFAVAGCSGSPLLEKETYSAMFTKKPDFFAVPTWGTSNRADTRPLGPSGPVAPEDLVAADGRCAAASEPEPAVAAQPAAGTTGSAPPPDRLERGPLSPTPTLMGGVALGMSECAVVRRAGHPGNVSVGSGQSGERKVVLTYTEGQWPGIYEFRSGRLAVIDAAPAPARPAQRTRTRATPPASGPARVYVQ